MLAVLKFGDKTGIVQDWTQLVLLKEHVLILTMYEFMSFTS